MSSLRYVGKPSSDGTDIITRIRLNNILNTVDPNRDSVVEDTDAAVAPYASQTYVNTQDNLYEVPSYYQTQDSYNVPAGAKGQANGVASLDSTGKIPVSQIPALGSGYIYGPYGPTATFTGTTSNVPLKIAEWNIGVQPLVFQPLVFGTVVVASALGRSVVEIRMSNGQQPYASQTRIGIGMGRSGYVDGQPITIQPAPASTAMSGSSADWPASTNIWATAWLYDRDSQTSVVTSGGFISGAIFLVRTQQ